MLGIVDMLLNQMVPCRVLIYMRLSKNVLGDQFVPKVSDGTCELEKCIADNYQRAFRSAYLILGNQADAEEAVQEAFLRAWKFRASISRETSIKPWLYRVVINSCYSKLRKVAANRDNIATGIDIDRLHFSQPSYTASIELKQAVLAAIEALPAHLRVPVVLRYYVDLSEREISIAIKKRPGTVKSRLHEARRLLAENPALQSITRQDIHDEEVGK